MLQRIIVASWVAVMVLVGGPVSAKGAGGAGPSRGASTHAGSSKGAASSKPVHVKTYTKKDGPTVEAHDRKVPEPRTGATTAAEPAHATPPPIRLTTDPVTGRHTFINAPPSPVAARPLPSAASMGVAPSTAMSRPPSVSALSRSAVVHPRSTRTPGFARSSHGRIPRSEAAKRAFEAQSGYPRGRPGYVIDHIRPLACGGLDAPINMQWQTIAAAKAKDRTERVGCR